jgi:hypothetical protein
MQSPRLRVPPAAANEVRLHGKAECRTRMTCATGGHRSCVSKARKKEWAKIGAWVSMDRIGATGPSSFGCERKIGRALRIEWRCCWNNHSETHVSFLTTWLCLDALVFESHAKPRQPDAPRFQLHRTALLSSLLRASEEIHITAADLLFPSTLSEPIDQRVRAGNGSVVDLLTVRDQIPSESDRFQTPKRGAVDPDSLSHP